MKKILVDKRSVICLVIGIVPVAAFSQNMNNPYSVYGIGDIDTRAYNRTAGMGSTGLAIKSSASFIDNNPAAIAGLPRSFYMAHISATGKTSTFSGDPVDATNSNGKDLWIKRLALAVKVNGWWASSAGFGQYSNVNYKFSGSRFVEGTSSSYKTAYTGDGGLNEFYWTNAVALGKHLSLGIKSSLIAGSVNQTETFDDASLQSTLTSKQQDYVGDLHFEAGVIYETKLSKKWDFSIGGKYSPKTAFDLQRTLTITENTQTIQQIESTLKNGLYLPQSMAGGIAFKHNKRTTIAADYSYEDWSSLHVQKTGWQEVSSSRISAGVEFAGLKNKAGKEADYRFFQFGGYFNNSYLQVRNMPIREYGFTGGIGGALGNSLLYALSLEAGIKGTTQSGLIKETYFGFTLNITYSDFLFSKGRKYE